MVKAKKYVIDKPFDGVPTDQNIKLVEEDLPALQDGDVLFQAVYLSVDPYMRPYLKDAKSGTPMIGEQLSKVVESKNKDYLVGSFYLVNSGWRTHTILNPSKTDVRIKPTKEYPGVPISLSLGTLGMPGATAYLGLNELLKPKAGDVVLVNAAAGAVGHVVGQVAKIAGCKVIGCASSPEKIAWLKELGFDVVFNYRTENLSALLSKEAPNGVNCYFDNVGGEFTDTVIRKHMAQFGRVAICGAISGYNATKPFMTESWSFPILFKCVTVQGFIVYANFNDQQWASAFEQMSKWIIEGKLKYREHVTNGFENMRKAFYELFSSDNIGKAIVKV